ncbi:MAG: hypothetical protein AAF578_00390 [Pseudomonadota bacterium]
MGEDVLEFIRKLSREVVHWPKNTIREEIYQHYKQEWEHMKKLRDSGVAGRIEFVAPRVMETDPEAYDAD